MPLLQHLKAHRDLMPPRQNPSAFFSTPPTMHLSAVAHEHLFQHPKLHIIQSELEFLFRNPSYNEYILVLNQDGNYKVKVHDATSWKDLLILSIEDYLDVTIFYFDKCFLTLLINLNNFSKRPNIFALTIFFKFKYFIF